MKSRERGRGKGKVGKWGRLGNVCLFVHSGVHHILCCVFLLFVFVLCTLYMLPVSLDGPFFIALRYSLMFTCIWNIYRYIG